jgi:hypothetical protein
VVEFKREVYSQALSELSRHLSLRPDPGWLSGRPLLQA